MRWGTGIGLGAMLLVSGMLLCPAALAHDRVDNSRETTIEETTTITNDRDVKETTDLSSVDGEQTTVEGSAIFAGDIVSGHNAGNDISLRDTTGSVTIDGGDAHNPTYVGMNIDSDGAEVYSDSEYSGSDSDAWSENSTSVDNSEY